MTSKYKLGLIGVRASKVGKAARTLKNQGWIKLGHAEQNNRNGFTHILFTCSDDRFDQMDWRSLANLGLEGIAIWMTDAQWGRDAAVTDIQWRDRRIIEADFNTQWPTGKR